MKIRTRLLLGIIVLVTISVFFTSYEYSNNIQISNLSEDYSTKEIKSLKNLYELKSKYIPLEYSSTEYLQGINSAKQEFMETKSEILLLFSEHESLDSSPSVKRNTFLVNAEETDKVADNLEQLIHIKNSLNNLLSIYDKIHSNCESGKNIFELKDDIELKEIEEDRFLDLVDEYYKMEETESLEIYEQIIKMSDKSLTTNYIFGIIFLSSIVGFGLMITNSISKPISQLKNSIQKSIAKEGYEEIPLKGDEEIKELINSFNEIRQSFKDLDLLKDKEFQSIKNITDLKHALDSSSNVTITDKDGTITYVNDKFCKISKYPKEDLIGQNHRLLKSGHHPPEFYTKMWRDISSGFVWRGDISNKAKDGSYYWVRTTIVPILDTNEKPFQYIAIRYDITQQKDIEEKLNEALAQVTKNDKLKDEFASMVTHELKTPLTPIRGYCEMLTIPNLMGTLNKEQLDSIKEIEVNAKRLEVLIGDVLDAQKIDMNQMSFTKSKISTDELMKNISNNVSFMIKNKNIELVNKTENNSIITDKKRAEQVMYNLISNAVDFVPDKNGRIEIGTKKEGSEIIFYVKDNGIGIHKNKQADLFKKFYQVDTSAKRQHGGTGLGLTICKGIVEGLGGKIWVKSDLGQGTTFYFSLPEGDDK